MKHIKDQISAIVVFKAETTEDLNTEYAAIENRCAEGLAKMEASNLFSEDEIKAAKSYYRNLLWMRFTSAKSDVVNTLRSNFEF